MSGREIGDIGETAAAKYLKRRGYKILSRNFSGAHGEIDIIGLRFGALVLFEVKTRSNEKFGSPADAMTEEKLNNIKSAYREFKRAYMPFGKLKYSSLFGKEKETRIKHIRIDGVAVYLENKTVRKVEHIKNLEIIL